MNTDKLNRRLTRLKARRVDLRNDIPPTEATLRQEYYKGFDAGYVSAQVTEIENQIDEAEIFGNQDMAVVNVPSVMAISEPDMKLRNLLIMWAKGIEELNRVSRPEMQGLPSVSIESVIKSLWLGTAVTMGAKEFLSNGGKINT